MYRRKCARLGFRASGPMCREMPLDMRSRHAHSYPRLGVGIALVAVGLLADGYAGVLVVFRANAWAMLLHIPAALIWSSGISVLEGQNPWHVLRLTVAQIRRSTRRPWPNHQTAERITSAPGRWTTTAVLLGLLLFPGFGPLGCTLAFGIAQFLRKSPHQDVGSEPRAGAVISPSLAKRPVDALAHLQVQPLVEILRGSNIELKRAAIEALGRQGDHEAVRLIRTMLTDPHHDVRGDAAVTLSHLEDDFIRALRAAAVQARESPSGAQRYAELCCRYASSDLLDPASSRLYHVRARDALEAALAQEPAEATLWSDLAQVHRALGDTRAAF